VFGAQHGGVFDSLCDTIGSLALLGTIVFIELDNKVSREPPTIVGLFVTQCSFARSCGRVPGATKGTSLRTAVQATCVVP
jgi:hypothetical protein